MVERIISGGQTGADRGGLDAALALGIPHGGWCPKGRRAEDGRIPAKYEMRETVSSDYPDRTWRNIADADATLVFVQRMNQVERGTQLTINLLLRMRKPYMLIDLSRIDDRGAIGEWLRQVGVKVLNVAGPRESRAPGIQEQVREVLVETIGKGSKS